MNNYNNSTISIKVPKSKLLEVANSLEERFLGIRKLSLINEYEFARYFNKGTNVIFYKSGKVVISGYRNDDIVNFILEYSEIGSNVGEFKYLIGIDETGKGEIIGNIIICGVLIDSTKVDLKELERLILGFDTKGKKKNFSKYQEVFERITSLGVSYRIEEVKPKDIKPKKTNVVMLERVRNILDSFIGSLEDKSLTRIVIDDFGIKDKEELKNRYDSKVVIEHKADDNYLECKVASIISRYHREKFLDFINSSGEYTLDGIKPLDGNLSNPNTIEWIRKWTEKNGKLPDFVKDWNIIRNKRLL